MNKETHVWNIPLYALFRLKDYIAYEMSWDESKISEMLSQKFYFQKSDTLYRKFTSTTRLLIICINNVILSSK